MLPAGLRLICLVGSEDMNQGEIGELKGMFGFFIQFCLNPFKFYFNSPIWAF